MPIDSVALNALLVIISLNTLVDSGCLKGECEGHPKGTLPLVFHILEGS